MSKVTVVGAGNVGATCANVLAVNEVANEVVLIDIKEGFAEKYGILFDDFMLLDLKGTANDIKNERNNPEKYMLYNNKKM